LIGPPGQIIRATDTFTHRYRGTRGIDPKQIEQVLSGGLDCARTGGEIVGELEAVIDRRRVRFALLTLPSETNGEVDTDVRTALRGRLQLSQAIGWIKDLEGRYQWINPSYTESLGIESEAIAGRTDAELPPGQAVDGPRIQSGEMPAQAPLQLEYTVDAFEGRPALAVLRFAVRDGADQAVAICGVAAPLVQAHIARTECERLMQIERWSRLGPQEIRAELLEEWGVAPPARQATESGDHQEESSPLGRSPDPEHVEALQQRLSELERRHLETQVEQEAAASRVREEAAQWQQRAEQADAAVHGLRAELEQARTDAVPQADLDQARSEAHQWQQRAEQAEAAVEGLRAELEQAVTQRDAHNGEQRQLSDALRTDLDQVRSEAHQWEQRAEQAEANVEGLRAKLEQARSEATAAGQHAHDQAEELRGKADHLTATLSAQREENDALRCELIAVQEQLDEIQIQASIQPAPEKTAPEQPEFPAVGPGWVPAAQHALSAALAGAGEWRNGLKDSVKVLGSHGGWDSITAWAPDDRGRLRCAAMWTAGAALEGFDTLTWQRQELLGETAVGRAIRQPHPTWVTDLVGERDDRLRAAANVGMQTALLVPIRDGVSAIAILELLTRARLEPDPTLTTSLDAVALQLGHFSHLLNLGASPHWHLGRL
jgi:PAS domain-containing protein